MYNLYQVQLSNGWVQRVNKENATLDKFNLELSMASVQTPQTVGLTAIPDRHHHHHVDDVRSLAGTNAARSVAPTGFTSKTSYLRSRVEKLEADLMAERESRKQVEQDLEQLRTALKRN